MVCDLPCAVAMRFDLCRFELCSIALTCVANSVQWSLAGVLMSYKYNGACLLAQHACTAGLLGNLHMNQGMKTISIPTASCSPDLHAVWQTDW